MPEHIVYVDRSNVRPGRLAELKVGMQALVDFVEANEPQIVTYNVFFNSDGTQMSVVNAHVDAASLAFHMKVAGPEFPKVAEFIDLVAIDVYGDPGADLVEQLRQKAQMLGSGTVHVHDLHGGFARFGAR
jgi:hypothetical protein